MIGYHAGTDAALQNFFVEFNPNALKLVCINDK